MQELQPPILGISKGLPTDKQQVHTSGYMKNVRPVDVLEKQLRLGQRPALEKWGSGIQIGDSEQPVVAFVVVAAVN